VGKVIIVGEKVLVVILKIIQVLIAVEIYN
jgi:hypothetical protein